MTSQTRAFASALLGGLVTIGLGAHVGGCKGSRGAPGLASASLPPPTPTVLQRADDLPGVEIEVLHVNQGANLVVGGPVAVTFTVKKHDGTRLPLSELDSGGILISGPTFNYQPVIRIQRDLLTRSVENPDGSWTYFFADPLPAKYPAPENDTTSFGLVDGELQGQDLLDGTYTIGIQAYKTYQINAESYRDAGVATKDVLFGGSATLQPREVIKNESCNLCHLRVEAHGGSRLDVRYCVLCHTSGAEDKNEASAAGGTPGVTIDFRSMIHKIHNGSHLPSVNGMSTVSGGARLYDSTRARKFEVVGFQNSVHDFSHVNFPVYPNAGSPMPRDEGYTALLAAEKTIDDQVRRGVTACFRCHGDPDGAGPLTAPAQGDVAYAQPSRRACGSCHDDIDWSLQYRANGQTMEAQKDDQDCATCHLPNRTLAAQAQPVQGVSDLQALAIEEAHRHPLVDPSFNKGLVFELKAVREAGNNDNDGTIDPGEKVEVEFEIKDDAGQLLPPAQIDRIAAVLSGPLWNRNLLYQTSALPAGALTGLSSPYRIMLPEAISLEQVGDATGASQSVITSRTPHWHSRGAATSVREVTGKTGDMSTLSAAAGATQNYVDLVSTAGFTNSSFVVLEDNVAGKEEYAQVGLVQGNRLWFRAPLRVAHASGAVVEEINTAPRAINTTFTLDEGTGTLTLTAGAFTNGNAVLVDYTSDFVLPSLYPPPFNDSPDVGETGAEWRGKAMISGTYQAAVWGRRVLPLTAYMETQSYTDTALASSVDFDVISQPAAGTPPIISSAQNCRNCHEDIVFHGSNRGGFDACVMCHGTAGSEDWAQWRQRSNPAGPSLNAPATPGGLIEFRHMLHKIHHSSDLAASQPNASPYVVAGNNGSSNAFTDIVFPANPGRTRNCTKCHGNDAWHMPQQRNHPTQQGSPALVWRVVCGSCHDSSAVQTHMATQTVSGTGEACMVCHGPGSDLAVEVVHRPREPR